MVRNKIIGWAALAAALLICSHCGLFPTRSEDDSPQFIMNLQYTGQLASDQSFPFYIKQKPEQIIGPFQKPGSIQSIDMVRVMVLDFSKYEDMEEFLVSEEAHAFEHILRDWSGDLNYWSEWETLFAKSFSIASNQTIAIEADSARGKVPGVQGLNYFIVAMLKDGEIRYGGGVDAIGKEGKTNTVYVEMEDWNNYYDDYYYYE